MLLYVARRLVWTVIVILVVLFVTFLVFFKLPPGDPVDYIVPTRVTPETRELVRERLGLNEPFYMQYGLFVKRFVTGDENGWPGLGYSYSGNVSVREQVLERAPRTLWLIVGAATMWFTAGVALGVISAVRRGTTLERGAMGFALFGLSAPSFWLGYIALYVFWRKLGWTGGTGYVAATEDPLAFFSHMILPWTVLALGFAAIYARVTRYNMLETLGEDYIRTARAKGLAERTVILRHGLRASLAPLVTMLGLDMALLVGGAVITEQIFNTQGLGWLAVNGALGRDFPMVIGVVMLSATAIAVMNLVVDVAYAFIDPRVRYV